MKPLIGVHEDYLNRKYQTSQVFMDDPQKFIPDEPVGWPVKKAGDFVVIHAGYLCQPASLKENVSKGALYHIRRALRTSKRLNLDGVVVHPGSGDLNNAMLVLSDLMPFRKQDGNKVLVFLENDVQAGGEVGSVSNIIKLCTEFEHTFMCLDTAHLYASKDEKDQCYYTHIKELQKEAGSYIKLIHLNMPNPEVGRASGLDLHSGSLSEGAVHPLQIINFINFFRNIPIILEAGFSKDVKIVKDFCKKVLKDE